MKKLTVNILDFPGFYDSLLSEQLDHEEQMDIDNLVERDSEEFAPELRLDANEFYEAINSARDYNKACKAICRDYVEQLNEMASEELGFKLGLEYESMSSPKFYNFETDRLFAFFL